MVAKDEETGLYGISNSRLIPILTKAIQEQVNIIENQEQTISNLQQQVDELKAQMEEVLKALGR